MRRAVGASAGPTVSRTIPTRRSSSPQGISRWEPPALAHADSFDFAVTREASETIILGLQMKKVTMVRGRNLATAKEQS